MDVYVLIGEQHAGKSSVTRCLTGCRKNGKRRIVTTLGNIDVYVELSSLQEKGKTAAAFVSEVDQTCDAVLVSLRPGGGYVYGTADSYLQHFEAESGWNIVRVACLGVPVSAVTVSLPIGAVAEFPRIPSGVPDEAANHIAAQIREHFNWV